MRASLSDTSTCPTCGQPFVEVVNEVVRGGVERVAIVACPARHEAVHTTTLVPLRRAQNPPATMTGEEADRFVAEMAERDAAMKRRRREAVNA